MNVTITRDAKVWDIIVDRLNRYADENETFMQNRYNMASETAETLRRMAVSIEMAVTMVAGNLSRRWEDAPVTLTFDDKEEMIYLYQCTALDFGLGAVKPQWEQDAEKKENNGNSVFNG